MITMSSEVLSGDGYATVERTQQSYTDSGRIVNRLVFFWSESNLSDESAPVQMRRDGDGLFRAAGRMKRQGDTQ